MNTKTLFAAILIANSTCALTSDLIDVPSDPGVTYTLIRLEGKKPNPIITTRRDGPSGTSFSKRLYDCDKNTFKYLSTGDTTEEMDASAIRRKNDKMTPLTPQSISTYIGEFACK